jgi:hypothetical protein
MQSLVTKNLGHWMIQIMLPIMGFSQSADLKLCASLQWVSGEWESLLQNIDRELFNPF